MTSTQDVMGDASPSSSRVRADADQTLELQHSNAASGEPVLSLPSPRSSPKAGRPPSPSLEDALASLSLGADGTTNMFRALASIFQASQMHEGNIDIWKLDDGREIWGVLRHADELETQGIRDVPSLAAVKEVLERMFGASSKLLLPALRIIADASRDASWRVPFGESGVLELGLAILNSNKAPDDLEIQALRLTGNACADTNENRERVISDGHLVTLMERMQNARVASVAVPVLYNVCCEYDPAQEAAVKEGLYTTLIKTIETGTLDGSPALGYLCRLLDLASAHVDVSQSPENTVELLLKCATQPGLDVDDSVSLVDAAVAHLQLERFQRHMVNQDQFGVPLRYLVRSYFPKAALTGARIPGEGATPITRDSDEEAELSRARKALIQALSDVSALSEFSEKHSSLVTPLIESLSTWITAALPQIQLCSCIVLGNLARDDATCVAMVSRMALHKDLISITRSSPDTQVIHSALGFIRNLAIPPENKDVLVQSGLIEALTRFWTADFMPQISHAAAAVARQLVIGSMANIEKLMAPLSADPESPAHARTYVSLLLSLFDRSDEVAVKMEVARTVAAILRCIHSVDSQGTLPREETLRRLYSGHPDIGKPLGTMVTQTRYLVVRSEGWFAMALMARNPDGAVLLSEVVTDVGVFTALEEAISGRTPEPQSSASATPMTDPNTPVSPGQPVLSTDMRAKDRDNAMILVNELLQHRDRDLTSNIRRSAFEELLQSGAQPGSHA